MNDKLIKRMQKLLEMSQDSSSEQEALIATKQLHAMLAKHNLTLTDIQKSDLDIGETKMYNEVNWPWKRQILMAISKLYFCSAYFVVTKKNYACYVIVGTEANRIFVESLAQHIFRVVVKASRKDRYRS